MKKIILAILLLCIATAANATVLTFDDIGVPGGIFPNYTQTGFVERGYFFSTNSAVTDLRQTGWSDAGPAHSGNFAAVNLYDSAITITKVGGGAFSVKDAFAKSLDAISVGHSCAVTGYRGNSRVGQVGFTMGSNWQDININLTNIDRLVIDSGWNNFILLDDLQVSSATPAPEPSAIFLLGVGIAGVAFLRRQKM